MALEPMDAACHEGSYGDPDFLTLSLDAASGVNIGEVIGYNSS